MGCGVCVWTQMAQQNKLERGPPAQQQKELDVAALHTSLPQPQQAVFIQPQLFALDLKHCTRFNKFDARCSRPILLLQLRPQKQLSACANVSRPPHHGTLQLQEAPAAPKMLRAANDHAAKICPAPLNLPRLCRCDAETCCYQRRRPSQALSIRKQHLTELVRQTFEDRRPASISSLECHSTIPTA